MNGKIRNIWVMIGSDSDLTQCLAGLNYLDTAVEGGLAVVDKVVTNSIHWNTDKVLEYAKAAIAAGVDVIVTGAGMANHLTGTLDAYLRRTLRAATPVVVGVAFESSKDPGSQAAMLSISRVPATQVIYVDFDGQFVGTDGFLRACVEAVRGGVAVLTIPAPRETVERSLKEAIQVATEKVAAQAAA